MKQSSTRRPRARRATARRLYFWSRKKPVFLAMLHVHAVIDAVLADLRHGARGRDLPSSGNQPFPCSIPSRARMAASLRSKTPSITTPSSARTSTSSGKSISLMRSMPTERVCVTSRLFKAVHRQAGEAVRLAEDDAAAETSAPMTVLRVVPGVADAAAPEVRIEAVVRVAGEQTDTDLALAGEKAAAKVFPFLAHRVHERTVFHALGRGDDLPAAHGWPPSTQRVPWR